MSEVRVVVWGVGSIGSMIAEHLLKRRGFKVVGAIDIDESKVGRDLGSLIPEKTRTGVLVSNDPEKVLKEARPHVTIITTTSKLERVLPQLLTCVRFKSNIVSTCEELSCPFDFNRDLAEKIDVEAKRSGVTVLGTGINPGFLMDTLVVVLTCPCVRVDEVRVKRVIDASKRRVPFQRKVGVGLSVKEFREMIGKEISGHVGLRESVSLISRALNWKLMELKEEVEPVISREEIGSSPIKVGVGCVKGLRQRCEGLFKDGKRIVLEFEAYVGADERDSIKIIGQPGVNQEIRPCIHGDIGTVAMVVNSIPRVIASEPGLKTMIDLPLPSLIPEEFSLALR